VGTEATSRRAWTIFKKDLSIEDSKKALAPAGARHHHGTSMILGFPDETEESIAADARAGH